MSVALYKISASRFSCRRLSWALISNYALHHSAAVLSKINLSTCSSLCLRVVVLCLEAYNLNQWTRKHRALINQQRTHCGCFVLCDVSSQLSCHNLSSPFFVMFSPSYTPMEEERKLMNNERHHHGAVENP